MRVHVLWDVCKAAGFALLGVLGKLISEARSHHSVAGRSFLRGGYSWTRVRAG